MSPDSASLVTRCLHCQNDVPPGHTICPHCRTPLTAAAPPLSVLDRAVAWVDRLADWLNERSPRPANGAPPPVPSSAARPAAPPVTQVLGARRVLPPPRAHGAQIRGYRIVQVAAQPDCTWYGAEAAGGQGYRYLLRETAAAPPLPTARWPQLPGLCVPVEAFAEAGSHFLVLAAPAQAWQTLDQIAPPVDLGQTLEWTLQIGHALRQLVPEFGPPPVWAQFRQALVFAGQARLGDLSVLGTSEEQVGRPDQAVLAALLAALRYDALAATGHTPAAGTPDAAVLTVMQQARAGLYPQLRDMLTALQQTLPPSTAAAARPVAPLRSLRQRVGYATDVGRQRAHNEDLVAKFDYIIDQSDNARPVGLYVVADGIGGYEGGEIASRHTAEQALRVFVERQFMPRLKKETQKLGDASTRSPQVRLLIDLVQEANAIVYRSNQAAGSAHGSTITVALVDGDRAWIANVGDSRAYLLRDGRLAQITEDHSLVFRLYRAGQITRDEIYTHDQKNMIFRSLGEKPSVEVDTYQHTLQRGDRLLLCSDGLWEMVRDDALATILAATPDAFGACDRLIDAANANGGADNISAIVVDLI